MWKKLLFFGRLIFILFCIKSLCSDILVSDDLTFTLYPKAGQVVRDIGKIYTNPTIEKLGCSITIVLMEPSISAKTLIALESVAANIRPRNRACFLLQTSVCHIQNNSTSEITNDDALSEVVKQVKSSALPSFYRMFQNGQVRVTIVDSAKYKFKACDNFYSPARAWLDHRYWGPDEFNDADPDQVLMIQSDVVLCHPLAIDKWRSYAWVAPPWPPKRAGEGGWCMCKMMPERWRKDHTNTKAPPFPSEEEMCSDKSKSPIGNGGYSLRSRSWIQRAISYCPHPVYSNLPKNTTARKNPHCHVSAFADQEDFILTTILRGIGAPFPDVYDAALFGAEMRFPVTFEKKYYSDTNGLESIAETRWFGADEEDVDDATATENVLNETALERFQRMRAEEGLETPIIPIGLHKPWAYHSWIKTSAYFKDECPYLFEMLEHVEKEQ